MGENTKKMYDKSETESKLGRFELGKSEKNRRNLKLIQTCDFFMFVNFDEKIVERTSACCEFFKISIDFLIRKRYYYLNGYQW